MAFIVLISLCSAFPTYTCTADWCHNRLSAKTGWTDYVLVGISSRDLVNPATVVGRKCHEGRVVALRRVRNGRSEARDGIKKGGRHWPRARPLITSADNFWFRPPDKVRERIPYLPHATLHSTAGWLQCTSSNLCADSNLSPPSFPRSENCIFDGIVTFCLLRHRLFSHFHTVS